MKHCAKKLLGLVFALALCLAVGGNALADGPEAADVWMLSDVWMLADEPNVTTAPDTTTVGDLANDGYTVTIPTTVEVNSTTNEGTLTVTAQMKQWRTLNIAIAPQDNKWTLKYQGATGENMPEVAYQLPQEIVGAEDYFSWLYHNEHQNLTFMTSELGGSEDVSKDKIITAKLAVTVPHSEEATMSGTYADTLTFYITPSKLCVTYNINVYKQDLKLTENGTHIAVVDKLDENGDPKEGARPDFTKTFEYPTDNMNRTWSYSSGDTADDTLRWEELPTVTMNPFNDKSKVDANGNVTINLNLKRKWYWLDVNGIVNYTGSGNESTDGNGPVGCYLDIRVSGDEGITWSPWYWYKNGDDYWGTFPYGTTFEIGFHHPKEGYVYDTDESGNVKVIANGEIKYTTKEIDNSSAGQRKIYKVFAGQLTGAPQEDKLISTTDGGNYHAEGSYQRYCFNVCCLNNTIVYARNDGTDTTETRKYDASENLPAYDAVFGSVQDGAVFMGWSTEQTVTSEDKLYQPGVAVTEVQWTDESHKKLYAIWGRKVDITIQFEDEKGYSTNDGTGPVAQLGGTMAGRDFVLKDQVVADGADWVLDLNNTEVKNAIDDATTEAKNAARDTRTSTDKETVWKIGENFKKECTIRAVDLQSGTPTLMIQRRRYLLSVISVDVETTTVKTIATNANEKAYGTFNVTINDGRTDLGVNGKSHCQVGLNYGAKYTVNEMKGIGSYSPMNAVILKSLRPNDKLEGSWFTDGTVNQTEVYTNWMTGKESSIHYYKTGEDDPKDGYVGDPVRVAFSDNIGSSDTPIAGPTLAPGLSGPTVGDADADGDDTAGDTGEDITQPPAGTGLTLRYHANFVADDAVEEAVKTVACAPGADVVLKTCMFKRAGYTFTGWNTEKDGMGRAYKANGVPVTDWSDGDTVDLYAQWEKTVPLKPVVSGFDEDTGLFDPFAPPEELDPGFGIDPDADPADEEGPADDADAVDDAQAVADEEAAAAPPEELDFGFGIDPDAAVGGPAPFVRW